MDLARESALMRVNRNGVRSFNPCFSGSCSRISMVCGKLSDGRSFNPCFSGSCSRIDYISIDDEMLDNSFNPCFSGSCSRINRLLGRRFHTVQEPVSILVLEPIRKVE